MAARTATFHLQLKTLDGVLNEQVPLVEDAYTLGRDTGCDIVLRRPTISKRHAKISRKGDTYEITDLVHGDTITEVLNYVQFDAQALISTFRKKVHRATGLSRQEANAFIADYIEGLAGYTYLEGD